MPVLISPDGQSVWCPSPEIVQDRLNQGYRLPAPESVIVPVQVPEPEPVKTEIDEAQEASVALVVTEAEPVQPSLVPVPEGALDLMTATLAELVALPTVGTASARRVRKLAQESNLNLDTLQKEVPEVSWVELYSQGLVVWPSGLHVVE